MNLLDIPGYVEALAREQLVRDAAFLPVNESIAGFEVLPLTLRHAIILRTMRSPFILEKQRTPAPEEVALFLWVLSPGYEPTQESRNAFLRRCRFFLPPAQPLIHLPWLMRRWEKRKDAALQKAAAIVVECRDYIDEAFQDRPPTVATVENEPDYFSDGAHYCGKFAREYHWSEETILNMPIKRIFQYNKETLQHHGNKTPLCNPSDKVAAQYFAARNAALKHDHNRGNSN